MIKKISLLFALFALLTTSCLERSGSKSAAGGSDNLKAVVKEVVQTSSYTYLRVDKSKQEQWIAIPKQDIKEGAVIYYEDGLEMNNFESPELHRVFETVYFVSEISDQPIKKSVAGGMQGTTPQKPMISKQNIKIDQPEGGISIGELFAKREAYSGKIVKVRGQVTKVNAQIMGRNWVHLQDGTSSGENFDLTVTTDHVPQVGDVVTYSGVLSLDKDFGAGYFYPLIIEEAVALK